MKPGTEKAWERDRQSRDWRALGESPEPIEDDDGTSDPIRMYLLEMATVPLLDREGEVTIARSIEHGERILFRALASNLFLLERLLTTFYQ